MASAPNMRVAQSLASTGAPAAPASEAGDFIGRVLGGQPAPAPAETAKLTGVALQQGLPILTPSGEHEIGLAQDGQADPEIAAPTAEPAPIDGLIPLVQAQGDYAVSVVKPPKSETVESDAPAETAEQSEVPQIIAAIVPPIISGSAPAQPASADLPATPKPIAPPISVPSPSAEPTKGIAAGSEPTPAEGPQFTTTTSPLGEKSAAATLRPPASDVAETKVPAAPTVDAATNEEASAQIAAALRSVAALPGEEARTDQRQRITLQASTSIARSEAAPPPAPTAQTEPRPVRPTERAPEVQTGRPEPAPESVLQAPQPQPVAPTRGLEIAAARIDPADQAVDRALDLAKGSEWLDQLARDIAGVGERDEILRFRLNPNMLGQMRIELSQTDQGAVIRMSVETEAARTILTDAQSRLVSEARAQGVRIAETNVDLSGSDQHMSGDPRRQEEARQNPMIRTAAAASERDAPTRPKASRSDRYA